MRLMDENFITFYCSPYFCDRGAKTLGEIYYTPVIVGLLIPKQSFLGMISD